MSSTKKPFHIFNISKVFCQSTSSSIRPNTSRAWFTSDNSQHKGKYAEQALYEGNTKGYNADEIVDIDKDKNEASEMGEKAKKSTDKGMDNAEHLREEMEDDVGEEIAQSIGEKAKQTVQGAWRAAKETTQNIKESVLDESKDAKGSADNVVYGEDEIVDEDHMKKLAKDPGGKPSEEDKILDVNRRPLAEKKS